MSTVTLFPVPGDNESPAVQRLKMAANGLVRSKSRLEKMISNHTAAQLNLGLCEDAQTAKDIRESLRLTQILIEQYQSDVLTRESEVMSACFEPCNVIALADERQWIVQVGEHTVECSPIATLEEAAGWVKSSGMRDAA